MATAILAAALSIVGLGVRLGDRPTASTAADETRSALMFGLSMKHTGLALILAGAVLSDQPLAILLIVLATLMQHLLAGLVQWWLQRERTPHAPRDGSCSRSEKTYSCPSATPAPARAPASECRAAARRAADRSPAAARPNTSLPSVSASSR